ncbi:hypothetical protein K2173_008718 [Erythroxylum novogranatense]|uniref:Uncharacterized protein n=1 Tax=Erythroxylum novogranatense TaxID=1862640 RepID=A0AAV8SLA7_9ROSI|nr:hypothetical protein K2173_008718 [Erythroxylum novogranatense]
MTGEKSPGLKILWLWTIGTAAVLVTNVVRTRLRDTEHLVNVDQQHQEQSNHSDSVEVGISPDLDDGIVREVKS